MGVLSIGNGEWPTFFFSFQLFSMFCMFVGFNKKWFFFSIGILGNSRKMKQFLQVVLLTQLTSGFVHMLVRCLCRVSVIRGFKVDKFSQQ